MGNERGPVTGSSYKSPSGQDADLHMVPAHLGRTGQRAVKWV